MRPQSCRRIDHGLLLLLLSFCVTGIMECARQCAVFFFPCQERENKIKEHLIQIFQKICRYLVLAIHKKYKCKLFTCVQTNRHVHPWGWDARNHITSPSKPHPINLMQIKRPYWNCQVPNLVFVAHNWNHSSLPPLKRRRAIERERERARARWGRERDNCLIRQ